MSSLFFSVGVKRLELSTPCTPCKCASQLRHTPNNCDCFSNNRGAFFSQKAGAKVLTFRDTAKYFFTFTCIVLSVSTIFLPHTFMARLIFALPTGGKEHFCYSSVITTVRRERPVAVLQPARPAQALLVVMVTDDGT